MEHGEEFEDWPEPKGYTGDYIVVHHPVSPFELYVFRDVSFFWDDDTRPARMRDHVTRPGGWHILEVQRGLGQHRDWLEEMVVESWAPVMIVTFFDGELCAIRGLAPGPDAAPWAVRLYEAGASSRYPTPKHRHLYPHPLPPEWMIADDLLSGAPAVEAIAAWSAATGGGPDRDALASLLAESPERFAEDLVGRLVDILGLSEHVELWYPHLFHGWDDPAKLERSIAALQPGRFRALDCVQHQNCFAAVRRRAEGDYLIEYGEPKADALRQTVTPSLAVVVEAMNAWARGETRWRDDFEWMSVPRQPD